jgi:hypothetical protein
VRHEEAAELAVPLRSGISEARERSRYSAIFRRHRRSLLLRREFAHQSAMEIMSIAPRDWAASLDLRIDIRSLDASGRAIHLHF